MQLSTRIHALLVAAAWTSISAGGEKLDIDQLKAMEVVKALKAIDAMQAEDASRIAAGAVAKSPEQLEALVAEDRARVARLRAYAPGVARYEAVCNDWQPTNGLHLGFVGFSKKDNVISIHFGRDLVTEIREAVLGFRSIARDRGIMLQAMGGCQDVPSGPPRGFNSDLRVQCVLTFEAGILRTNGCRDIAELTVR